MKKITFVLMAICLLAVSCKQDTPDVKNLKKQLAADFDVSELGIDLKYKLINLQFIDTIYYGDTINGIIAELDDIWVEPTKEKLIDDAKFAREYIGVPNICNALDSLANSNDEIKKYDYKYIEIYYNYVYSIFRLTNSHHDKAEYVITHSDEIKEKIAAYNEMKSHAPDEIYGYRLQHDYQIFNPLFQCEQKSSEVVTVDNNLVIL